MPKAIKCSRNAVARETLNLPGLDRIQDRFQQLVTGLARHVAIGTKCLAKVDRCRCTGHHRLIEQRRNGVIGMGA